MISLDLIQNETQMATLNLKRDITKHIKRGHRWIFANAFDEKLNVKSGIYFLSYKDELLGLGIYQSDTQLRFRILTSASEFYFKKNNPIKTLDQWSEFQWRKAVSIRESFNFSNTNSFRFINGEGDGFPGLIIDIYGNTAVIKHDHAIMEKVWDKNKIAQKLISQYPNITCVYLKRRNDDKIKGENIIGQLEPETIFKENELFFASNIRDAAKTGFFLDQRDNRLYIKNFSKNKSVLNLFSYTGGFSVFAAAGGASQITSVDIAKVAIQAVKRNFELNNFKTKTEDLATDAFDFVDQQLKLKTKYDLVITDPPSFAPNEKSVPQATAAYTKIFSDSIKLVNKNGFFAASSCSSHISTEAFFEILQESFSKARLNGTLLHVGAQPFDHPFPLAMQELRYLKFAFFRID